MLENRMRRKIFGPNREEMVRRWRGKGKVNLALCLIKHQHMKTY